VVDEEDIKHIKPLPNLDYKIVQGNSLIGVEKNLFNNNLFIELEKLKPLHFNETNHIKKQGYKKQIDELIRKITNGHKEFDFEVYFSEVFHNKDGFDVVIANPPYIQIKNIHWNERKIFEKKYKSAVGRFNIFYFFIEKAGKIARQKGVSSFIVPDRLLLNTQCDELRKWLLQDQTIIELVSFKEGVFEAVVDSIIIFYMNERNGGIDIRVKNKINIEHLWQNMVNFIPVSYFRESQNKQFDLSYNPFTAKILEKIKAGSACLGDISDVKDGIIQGKVADKLFLNTPLDNFSKKLLFGVDITKYKIHFNNNWVNYKPIEMMQLELKRRGDGVRHGLWLRDPEIFERPKILTRQTADEIIAAYDTKNYYYSNTLHGTTITDTEYDPLYVLALLNSRLMTWYYRRTTAEEGKVFAQIKIALLRLLPIKLIKRTAQNPFIDIVYKIQESNKDIGESHNNNKQEQIKEYKTQIDRMVYELYGLTEKEIKIVEEEAK
jgi:adenine-specific DNA methylase